MTIKDKILGAMNRLPEDATIEDVIYRLELLQSIERGLEELDQGLGVDHEEVFAQLLKEDAQNKTDLVAHGTQKPSGNKTTHSQRRAKNRGKLHKTA